MMVFEAGPRDQDSLPSQLGGCLSLGLNAAAGPGSLGWLPVIAFTCDSITGAGFKVDRGWAGRLAWAWLC